MRWGVRDHALDDHATTDICLQEIKTCQRVSTGPSFVVSKTFGLNIFYSEESGYH